MTIEAEAMSDKECARLDGNQFLAAIERGACGGADIVTAAGPDQETASTDDGGRDGRNGGGNEGGGGDGGSGGSSTGGGGRAGASPNKP
jgi:hypothetical protein